MSQLPYQRFHAATAAFRDEPEWPTPATIGGDQICGCCNRPFDTVEDPGLAIAYRYETAQVALPLCTTCYTPKHGSSRLLGIERAVGKTGRTVAGKLGMLINCGAIITPDNTLYLALSSGYASKFRAGTLVQRGQTITTQRPADLFWQLYARGELANLADGCVVIEPFGRKSLALMGALKATYSLNEVWINSSTPLRFEDRAALLAIADWARQHQQTDAVCTAPFWRPIRDAALGRVDRKRLEQWHAHTPGADDLLARLPPDPYTKTALHQAMQCVLAAVP
ncbi:hypothetical protein [Salinisphaera orenii]|uniref:hypothetical protein n=1 Tax=Salinisphaera orenii TaxID=856731 RepID=UPI000DBE2526